MVCWGMIHIQSYLYDRGEGERLTQGTASFTLTTVESFTVCMCYCLKKSLIFMGSFFLYHFIYMARESFFRVLQISQIQGNVSVGVAPQTQK